MKRTAIFMETPNRKRRAFLRALTTTTAAFAVARCGGGGPGDKTPPANAAPASAAGPNNAPVWATIPTVAFTQGVASSFSLESFVSDPDGDALTITMNAVTLPAGVTFDAVGKRLVYDGIADTASVDGVQMTADDGRT